MPVDANGEEGFEILLRLPGETDHHRRAQREIRGMLRDVVHQHLDVRAGSSAVHKPEHVVARVLQRHVQVMDDLVAFRDPVDQLGSDRIRVRIQHADPFQRVDPGQAGEELDELRLSVEVTAIAGGILGDQGKLRPAAVREPPSFWACAITCSAIVVLPEDSGP